jgi:D-apiose dehydrogenase
MRLRGAIVGCGMISEFHLRGWQRIPEVDVVALVDPVRGRAEERRAQFAPHARVHETLDSLFASEAAKEANAPLDFVDILTPPWLHREQCLRAAQAGVHIICQKPLCQRLEDAQALVAELQDYDRLFLVHENHPYRPWFREMLQRQRAGFFGQPRFLHLTQHDTREPPETFKAEAERGVLLEYGVHLVDMVRALLGEPGRVSARLQRINPRVRGESLAHVVFEYPETTAVLDISWKAHGLAQGSVLLVGDAGEAFFEGRMTRGDVSRFRITAGSAVVLDEQRSPTEDYVDAFFLLQREFTDGMLGGPTPVQQAVNNLKTLTATFAAYQAAAEGAPVVLTPTTYVITGRARRDHRHRKTQENTD